MMALLPSSRVPRYHNAHPSPASPVLSAPATHLCLLGNADDGVNVQVAGYGLHVLSTNAVRLIRLVAVGL